MEWDHPEGDKDKLSKLVFSTKKATDLKELKDFTDTKGFFEEFDVGEHTSPLFYVKMAGAYCFNHLRIIAKNLSNLSEHFTNRDHPQEYSKFINSFMSLYPEEVNSFTPPKKMPMLSTTTLTKLKVLFGQRDSRAVMLCLRTTAVLNDQDRNEDHQIINAFGGMTIMGYGLTV